MNNHDSTYRDDLARRTSHNLIMNFLRGVGPQPEGEIHQRLRSYFPAKRDLKARLQEMKGLDLLDDGDGLYRVVH